MSLFNELKRRNVIRVASAYAVTAWLLIQIAETVFPVFGFSQFAVQIVIVILAIGFVPVLALAWVFEWTPEGLKFDSDAAVDVDTRRTTSRRLDRAFLVVLAVAVGYFAIDKFVFDPARDSAREQAATERGRSEAITGFYGNRSIAVLPFVNMSSDPEQEFFADGISEEILNLLAKIRELRVISRSSAFTFKGKDIEIPEIAEQLNVGHILEGSVRKSGDRVRVTAQLIEARTDTHLWSETYDRSIENIFAIQDEIARDVARNLELRLLQDSLRARVTDPEAYALTLQAKQVLEVRTPNCGAESYALLSKALEIDPDYVPALEWMLTADFFREQEGLITRDEMYELYDQLKPRILRLDPENPIVLAGDGWEAFRIEQDYDKAAEYYERMLAGSLTNSNAIRLAATYAVRIGRFDTALRLAELSVAIDPLCFMCLYWESRINLYAGNYDRALEVRERFLRLGSGGDYHHGLIKLLQGDPAAALAIYETMESAGEPNQLAGLAMAHHDLGHLDQAKETLRLLYESADDAYAQFFLTSEVAAWMGDNDKAFKLFEQIVSADAKEAHGLVFNPVYKKLHSDPRWTELRNSIGMSEERLAAIQFDPVLPE